MVTWGDSSYGGDSRDVATDLLSGVTEIFSTARAFAALTENGNVVTWGRYGGDSSGVAEELLSGVTEIFSTDDAFAALKEDGRVVTWGHSDHGADSSSVASSLDSGVTSIFSTRFAFAALKEDGSVVTWGDSEYGGDSSAVATELFSSVTGIFSTGSAFAALKDDGSVVTWGDSTHGGDSSDVVDDLADVVGMANIYTNDWYSSDDPAVVSVRDRLVLNGERPWLLVDGADVDVIGNSQEQTVQIDQGAKAVLGLAGGDDRVELAGNMVDYAISTAGSNIVLTANGAEVRLSLNAADNDVLVFADGAAVVHVDPIAGGITLAGELVAQDAASNLHLTSALLDASDFSTFSYSSGTAVQNCVVELAGVSSAGFDECGTAVVAAV